MIKWERVGKKDGADGVRIIYKAVQAPGFKIESWRRQIPHANGVGSWEFTSYLVYKDGEMIAEKNALTDAKLMVEKMLAEVPDGI